MEIAKRLKALEAEDNLLKATRYFDCEGNPYECDVFLVGINPSKGLNNGKIFWQYWDATNGFELEKWLTDYKQEVKKEYNRELKPTRQRIEKLREILAKEGLKLFNCNIYNYATKRQNDLKEDRKSTKVFEEIIDEFSPKVLILQGQPPKKLIAKLARNYNTKAENWTEQNVIFPNFNVKIISVPHLYNMALSADKNANRNIEELAKIVLNAARKTN